MRNFKNVAPQKQNQFVKQERNNQNAIVLLNYLQRIAPQQLCQEHKFAQKNVIR